MSAAGAWLAASGPGGGGAAEWAQYQKQMEALLAFWARPPRRDLRTGLATWHDQMESGADNGVLSRCPSPRSACWRESAAYSLASADVITLLQREHTAMARFAEAWAREARDGEEEEASEEEEETSVVKGRKEEASEEDGREEQASRRHSAAASNSSDGAAFGAALARQYEAAALRHRLAARSLRETLNAWLWRSDLGFHVALNLSTSAPILSRTYAMAYPLWARLVNRSQAAAIARNLASSDMLSSVGLRSAGSSDPRYSNADTIVPYS